MGLYNIKSIVSRKPKIGLMFPGMDILPPYPLFLLTHITLSCDQKCNWCYQAQDQFYSLHNRNMQADVFRRILSSFRFFKPHVHIYGGEPLLHPDFPLFLEYCRLEGYRPTLTTNGNRLNRYSADIMKSSLSQLNISLNGLIGPQGSLRGDPGRGLMRFLDINRGKKKINLNYVVDPDSCDYLEDVALYFNRTCKRGSFSNFVIQHFMASGSRDEERGMSLDVKKLAAVLGRLKKMNLKFRIISLPDIRIADLSNYYDFKYAFGDKCYVPWLGLSIYPDSAVTPGSGVLGCNFVLGNLNRSSLRQIWRGEKFRSFRRGLLRNRLPGICNRCCHKLYY